MNINYDYYRLFYYVAKYKNLSLVASLLNSNQPNLSKLMKKLEQQMGCKLMNRTNRGVVLTKEGEILYKHVAIAYHEIRAAEAELSFENDMGTGLICIGSTVTAEQLFLNSTIAEFRSKYPNIAFFISSSTSAQAIETLRQGIIDFAIVDTPFSKKLNFKQTVMKEYREILVASSGHPLTKRKSLKLDILRKTPLIGFSNYPNNSEFHSKFFAELGLVWQPEIGVSQYNQIIPLVMTGAGIAFIPDFMAEPYIQEGKLVQLSLDKFNLPKRYIVLLEDKELHSSIVARKFIQVLKEKVLA